MLSIRKKRVNLLLLLTTVCSLACLLVSLLLLFSLNKNRIKWEVYISPSLIWAWGREYHEQKQNTTKSSLKVWVNMIFCMHTNRHVSTRAHRGRRLGMLKRDDNITKKWIAHLYRRCKCFCVGYYCSRNICVTGI